MKANLLSLAMLFVTTLALSSCGPKLYVHSTKNATDFNRDKFDCQQVATQNAYQMGMAGNPFWIASQTQECLVMKHGWVEQASQSSMSASLGSTCAPSNATTGTQLRRPSDGKMVKVTNVYANSPRCSDPKNPTPVDVEEMHE